MPTADVTAVVARLVTLIGSVDDIGLVHGHDIYDREDVRSLIVSDIDGTSTMRAWWVTGPTMSARRAEQREAGYTRRRWVYTIHGLEGLSADGDSIDTLRANAASVSDVVDADFDLAGACHMTEPCAWSKPINRRYVAGMTCSYVEISKPVVTLTTLA